MNKSFYHLKLSGPVIITIIYYEFQLGIGMSLPSSKNIFLEYKCNFFHCILSGFLRIGQSQNNVCLSVPLLDYTGSI